MANMRCGDEMPMKPDIAYVLKKLNWMRAHQIWPNGSRYLWTDAFGVVLLVSLSNELGEDKFLDEAEWVVAEVKRVLGRPRGIRIGEESDRDGQYFHYLAMWLYALAVLGRSVPKYRHMGINLVHQVHDTFLVPSRGVIWKMKEDLTNIKAADAGGLHRGWSFLFVLDEHVRIPK